MQADINSTNPPIQTFANDPSRDPVASPGSPISQINPPIAQIIPEPTTLVLLVVGLGGLAVMRRRRK